MAQANVIQASVSGRTQNALAAWRGVLDLW